MISSLNDLYWVRGWKVFEYRPIFAKVMGN